MREANLIMHAYMGPIIWWGTPYLIPPPSTLPGESHGTEVEPAGYRSNSVELDTTEELEAHMGHKVTCNTRTQTDLALDNVPSEKEKGVMGQLETSQESGK